MRKIRTIIISIWSHFMYLKTKKKLGKPPIIFKMLSSEGLNVGFIDEYTLRQHLEMLIQVSASLQKAPQPYSVSFTETTQRTGCEDPK